MGRRSGLAADKSKNQYGVSTAQCLQSEDTILRNLQNFGSVAGFGIWCTRDSGVRVVAVILGLVFFHALRLRRDIWVCASNASAEWYVADVQSTLWLQEFIQDENGRKGDRQQGWSRCDRPSSPKGSSRDFRVSIANKTRQIANHTIFGLPGRANSSFD